ncbi:DUF551 domain-containing protein [Klebsiella aerogenes]
MSIKPVSDLYLISYEDGSPYKSTRDAKEAVDAIEAGFKVEEFVSLENHRAAMLQAEPVTTANKLGNSPVIPDGWKLVPIDATRSMIDAARRVEEDGYDAMHKAMLAAAPQDTPALNSVQSVVTVSDAWIPVSERMPEFGDYLVTDGCDFDVQLFNGEAFIPGFVWEDKITHWMPLPAAPQEVKSE